MSEYSHHVIKLVSKFDYTKIIELNKYINKNVCDITICIPENNKDYTKWKEYVNSILPMTKDRLTVTYEGKNTIVFSKHNTFISEI